VEFDYPYARKQRPWLRSRGIHQLFQLLRASDARAAEALDGFVGLRKPLSRIRARPAPSDPPGAPQWDNEYLPPLDGLAIYGFLARTNPRVYLEIGSGNSTRFAARAIADHGLRTRIVSIDPHPRAEIDALCDEVVRAPLEELEPERFMELTPEDVLFLDGSHRSFQSSDVTVFFLEVLPVLPRGLLYGIHDVFLPADYPEHWIDRWYNEQYLLATHLLAGAGGDEIVLPCAHAVSQEPLRKRLDPLWTLPELAGMPRFGSSFWLRRGALPARG
jgi:hypothetical protein